MMKEHNINESMTPGKQWDKIREHDTSSRFGNDTRAEDADIKTANDKEPMAETFPSSTTKVDCKPPNGSNEDITNPYECDQTLNVSAGPMLHSLTLVTFSSGLVSNNVSQKPCIPLNRDDWDHFFQPMFNEYFNPATIDVSSVLVVAAPRAVDLADSPVSTSIDQDAPSTSIPSTQVQEHSLNISQGFEESPKTPIFFYDALHEDSSS
uniref:Integrase, catalytic region, zinc finger, CCHC-type, peptidase aspartic, catalytic n=1 Tax=Tanacetum cinerariifolium TaxID=118510 RepID=A0A699I6Z6_TANCI|nr:hypothetical protein [Tanacetum cinerariifolium]